jgi:hypothetical protein
VHGDLLRSHRRNLPSRLAVRQYGKRTGGTQGNVDRLKQGRTCGASTGSPGTLAHLRSVLRFCGSQGRRRGVVQAADCQFHRPRLVGYQPRAAEHTVLYRVIDEHLETFLDTAAHHADGRRLPKFVEPCSDPRGRLRR